MLTISCVAYLPPTLHHWHTQVKKHKRRCFTTLHALRVVCRHQVSMYTYTSFIMQLPGSAMFLARLAHSSHTFAKRAWVLPYTPACAYVLDGCRPQVMRVCSPAKPRAADAAAKICGAALPGALYKHGYTAPRPCLVYLSLTLWTRVATGCAPHLQKATPPSDTLAIGTRHPSPAPWVYKLIPELQGQRYKLPTDPRGCRQRVTTSNNFYSYPSTDPGQGPC